MSYNHIHLFTPRSCTIILPGKGLPTNENKIHSCWRYSCTLFHWLTPSVRPWLLGAVPPHHQQLLLMLENPNGILINGKLPSLWCLQCFEISWKSKSIPARAFCKPLSWSTNRVRVKVTWPSLMQCKCSGGQCWYIPYPIAPKEIFQKTFSMYRKENHSIPFQSPWQPYPGFSAERHNDTENMDYLLPQAIHHTHDKVVLTVRR